MQDIKIVQVKKVLPQSRSEVVPPIVAKMTPKSLFIPTMKSVKLSEIKKTGPPMSSLKIRKIISQNSSPRKKKQVQDLYCVTSDLPPEPEMLKKSASQGSFKSAKKVEVLSVSSTSLDKDKHNLHEQQVKSPNMKARLNKLPQKESYNQQSRIRDNRFLKTIVSVQNEEDESLNCSKAIDPP